MRPRNQVGRVDGLPAGRAAKRPRPAANTPPTSPFCPNSSACDAARESALQPLAKIPVANRGEIAVRALCPANEACRSAVAVFAEEGRLSLHRFKADGSCRIGAGRGRQALARNRSLACFGANSDNPRGGFPEALSRKILRGGAPSTAARADIRNPRTSTPVAGRLKPRSDDQSRKRNCRPASCTRKCSWSYANRRRRFGRSRSRRFWRISTAWLPARKFRLNWSQGCRWRCTASRSAKPRTTARPVSCQAVEKTVLGRRQGGSKGKPRLSSPSLCVTFLRSGSGLAADWRADPDFSTA